MPLVNGDYKHCPKCGLDKLKTEFYKHSGRFDGLQSQCKPCMNYYVKRNDGRKEMEWHGMTNTSTYQSWADMKTRCNNPKHRFYTYYGGRGITYCSDWESFVNFFRDMGVKPIGYTLERIDNDGMYCKENCKWATRAEQNRNKRGRWDKSVESEVGACAVG